MRDGILTMCLALALSATQRPLPAAAQKPLPADVGPGRVAWFDIATTDLPRAKAFYGKLFDWRFGPVAGTDQAAEIRVGATAIGTLRGADGKLSAYNGVVYVQVTDLPGRCAKARELGGTVVPGFPFDLPGGVGAIALLIDPTGHPIGMYAREPLAGKAAPAK